MNEKNLLLEGMKILFILVNWFWNVLGLLSFFFIICICNLFSFRIIV